MVWEPMRLDGLLGVRAVGDVTQAALMDALSDLADSLNAGGAVAQVVHYEGSRLAMTPQAMASTVLAAAETMGPVTVPTALIVSPDQFEHWATYTKLMGERGVLRGVFSGPEASERAQRWAHEMAQVAAAMRSAWRAPSRSGSAARQTDALALRQSAR